MTPTHGPISKWILIDDTDSKELVEEVALLVPRSWWGWWLIPMPNKNKADLFYLEAQNPYESAGAPVKKI